MSAATAGAEAIWHDTECGAYAADLAVWEGLAREAAGPVLELGAGTGRVALRLAAAGVDVAALDRSAELLAELERRARERALEVEAKLADARDFGFDRRFAAILAPMQFVHLLGGERGRMAMLEACARQLRSGGALAAALLDRDGAGAAATAGPGGPLPDVREVDGWIYSSLPVEVRQEPARIVVRRLRQLVSPAGELTERAVEVELDRLDPERFESEASAAGFEPRERLRVEATDDHVGSTICVLETGR